MRIALLSCALVALVAAGCGGPTPATVKGRLVSNGEPMSVTGQVAVTFTLLDSASQSYTAMVNPDGSFEVIVSGGQLPPGTYQVSIVAVGKQLAEKFKGLVGDKSPVRRELKSGPNEITIDVAKPEG